MQAQAPARSWLARTLLAIALAVAGAPALAQAPGDPPGRVARLDHVEGGAVSFLPAGDDEWVEAPRNRPITRGDQLWTDSGARAELHLGSTALRLDERTQLQLTRLDDNRARLSLPRGTASLRVRRLHAGEQLTIDTPNLAFAVTQPGEYRLDVDPASGTTRVTLHAGQGTVSGRNGQTLGLAAPQQLSFSGRDLAQLHAPAAPRRDDFDQWAAARDRQEDRSVSARYLSRATPGYQQLDQYGDWRIDPGYGPVWYPHVTVVNWAPYRYGHWEYIPPWGWTWIDDAPWGFAPFHYGRWVQISLRWVWVPGPIVVQPVYAPALVAFVGTSGGHIALSAGQPGMAWFPLAPGEAFRPAYRASRPYLERINRHQRLDDRFNDPDRVLRYQRRPEAVTVVPREQFGRRQPARGEWRAPAPAELERGRVVPAPRFAPERRRDENEVRRAPPEHMPPGWAPRQQRIEGRADERPRERFGPRFEGRDENPRHAGPPQREPARREQAVRDQQREHEQNLRRDQAMREQGERRQRAEQEQMQRRQQEQQLRQQREHEQNLRREQAERQQHASQEQRQQQAQQLRQQHEQNLRREQAERQQRTMQEQAQRQQQRAERLQQRQEERQRQHDEPRRVHGERRQRVEGD